MSRNNRLRIADLAQEVGISESEAIECLKRSGMEAYKGYRVSASDLQKAREILAGESKADKVRQELGLNSDLIDESTTAAHFPEVRTTIRDAVEAWLNKNPMPKHIVVEGRSYSDFIDSCIRYLQAHALKHGAESADIMIGSEDRRQIEAFLNRAKALWDKRLQEEGVRADARRQAERQRQAEKKRQIETLNKSKYQMQSKLLQEDRRLLEERLLRIEARRKREEQRTAEERTQQDSWRNAEEARAVEEKSQHEAQLHSELAARKKEQTRIEQLFAKHRKNVANEAARLQAGQCSWADYYAYILQDRIERSAELLFGSAKQPSYELLQKDSELLAKLKGNLSFADDRHPRDYHDPYVSAYYTLRYELGYAFEYSQIYQMLLGIMQQNNETALLDVLSIGSGQGLDYWGLCYALSKQASNWPRIGWHGVDLEKWPDHIIDDGFAQYSDGTDLREVLASMNDLNAKVLMFPKVISELSAETIGYIVSWLEHVTYTRDVHYLCFAHTERKSLDPSDAKHKGPKDCFRYPIDSSLDAVKSAALIDAACNSAKRQLYSAEITWCDLSVMSVSYYDVAWSDSKSGEGRFGTYSYINYGVRDVPVGQFDPVFKIEKSLYEAVKGIGHACCKEFISDDAVKDCNTHRVSCNNSFVCPLHRYPRFKTGGIAYQIVRLVKQASYDEDIPF